ncbi:MAG TPA: DUF4142 domain-containing protein [Cyclobacteriaceae bacterium]|nr:DUF4142 domain-containing protein [Cyclobacteriaceae bacterium]
MKNNKHFRNAFLLIALGGAIVIGASSFKNFKKQKGTELTLCSVKTDAQFLIQAAQINLEEIQLGQLAQKKSMMTDVKELGELMEKNHKQALSELTTLATKKGVSLPTEVTSDAKEKYTQLNNESEKKFNEEYCELMVKGHKEAIALFETASKEAKDPEIKEWASSTLPILRTHLEHSKMCKAKCEKM